MEPYLRYKCPRCQQVHAAIPLAEAEQHIAVVNRCLVTEGKRPSATLADYSRCCYCGTSSTEFLPARAEDSYPLATLQGVVVPGTFAL